MYITNLNTINHHLVDGDLYLNPNLLIGVYKNISQNLINTMRRFKLLLKKHLFSYDFFVFIVYIISISLIFLSLENETTIRIVEKMMSIF